MQRSPLWEVKPFRAAAFSLIEIMVAVSLLALIIVGLLAMFYQVQRAFRAGTAQVDILEGGRATMSVLTRDLQEMASTRFDGSMNFLVVPSEFTRRPPDSATVQRLPSSALRDNYLRDFCFLSRANDEWIATAYRVAGSATGVGTLYRMQVRRTNDSNPLISEQVIRDLSWMVATSRVDHTNFHQVVDGVVHLWADAYTGDGLLSSNAFFHVAGQASTLSYGFTNRALPAFVDLELAILEPGAVEKFRARLDSAAPDTPTPQATTFLEKQIGRTHFFRQRVAIKAGRNAANLQPVP